MIECEHEFSETISEGETKARQDYLSDLQKKLEILEENIFHHCAIIAGTFRGPGMKKECEELVKMMSMRLKLANFS